MPYAQLKQLKGMKYIPVGNTDQHRNRSATCGVAQSRVILLTQNGRLFVAFVQGLVFKLKYVSVSCNKE